MAINYDQLTQGLLKTTVKVSRPATNFTFGQSVLFGNPEIGTDQDYINYEAEVGSISVPAEGVKGLDPTRVNYGSSFDVKMIASQYFFLEDTVDLSSAEKRLFGEPVEAPWSKERRILELVAKKRDAMNQSFVLQKELLAFQCLLNGKFSTKGNGEQSYPMKSELLGISGATMLTKPIETLNKAVETLFKEGVIAKRLILNPTDAANLVASSAWQKVLDVRNMHLGSIIPAEASNGVAMVGTLSGIISGPIEVYTYAGYYDNEGVKTFFLPQGKALLLPADPVGCFAYTGLLVNEGDIQAQVNMKDRYFVYGQARGDLVTTLVQGQTAPAPILQSIDGYGVITGIPASV